MTSDGEKYRPIFPNMWASGREGTTSQLGFGPVSMKKELTRGTKHAAGLLVGYSVVPVGQLMHGQDLIG